jgi:DNA-cytosine methyltransferase
MNYFSMFSGIGGFELGIQNTGTTDCVGYSELDKHAVQIYRKHFPKHRNFGDATAIVPSEIPSFDLLTAGFPCQSFSIAGKRQGFEDTRGTLFYEIARIASVKRPKLLFLENVKGLLSHDNGQTFGTILSTLSDLGYVLEWQILNSKDYGVPQNRERVFIVGQRKDAGQIPVFPLEYDKRRIGYEITREEKVYLLPKRVSQNIKAFLADLPFTQKKQVSKQQMSQLLKDIKQGIQEKECREIEREPQEIRQQSEGDIQKVETVGAFLESANDSRGICGVVQIPTEEMLLLWDRRETTSCSFRQVQQQDLSFNCGQDRLVKRLSNGEYSSLLFTVQPYQGRLFYSIGNGRDWQNIYISEVDKKCNPTLSCILEEQVDQKYFLSEKSLQRLIKRGISSVFLEQYQQKIKVEKLNGMGQQRSSKSDK